VTKKQSREPSAQKQTIFSLNSREKLDLAIICLLVVVLRLIYLAQYHDSFIFGKYLLDSEIIDRLAHNIASGDIWGKTAFFCAPLYIYLVALI
jgi:Na+-transporting methylmalonyl-CoA/oxaloacetate decarboxylase beta subunit